MPTPDELARLLLLPNETLAVEYKSWLDLADNAGKATLAKAAIALANHGGGIIVLGMWPDKERGGALISRQRPDGLGRYSQDDLNAAINRYADPRFHCELLFSAHPETRNEHAFVIVPGGMTVPVMSARECPGIIGVRRCYIRKPGPQSEEPTTSAEWRTLLDNCVRAGRENMLDAIRVIVQGRAGGAPAPEARDVLVAFVDAARARWRALVEPLPPQDPARMLLGQREFSAEIVDVPAAPSLLELRRRIDEVNRIKHTGWHPLLSLDREPHAPRVVDGVIETWLGAPTENRALHDPAHCDFWRAHSDGRIYHLRGYSEDGWQGVEPGRYIDLTNPIWRIGESMLFVARLAVLFGDGASLIVRCRLTGLRNRTLAALAGRRALAGRWVRADDDVALEMQASAAQVRDNLAEVVHPFLVPFYERFSFFELPMAMVREELEEMRRGRF